MRSECADCYYHKRIYKKEKGCVYSLYTGETRVFMDGKCVSQLVLNKQDAQYKYREHQNKIFASVKRHTRRDIL